MRAVFVLFMLACALSATQGRQLLQKNSYPSLAEALKDPRLSTLAKAIKASGIKVPDGATIFAPTNQAFADDDIREKTGLTLQQILGNKPVLTQVGGHALTEDWKILQYHVVPGAVVRSNQLRKGQQLRTALPNTPLFVDIDDNVEIQTRRDGGVEADVVVPNIKAGKSVVHVINEVLIPPRLVRDD